MWREAKFVNPQNSARPLIHGL